MMRRLAMLTVVAVSTGAFAALPAHAAKVSVAKYVNGVCNSLTAFGDDIEAKSKAFEESAGESTGAEEVKTILVGFLDEMVDETQELGTDLKQAGTPTLKDGSKIAAALRSGIAQMEAVITQARDDAEAISATDPDSFEEETLALLGDMTDAIDEVSGGFDSLDKKYNTLSLEKAQKKDPDCRSLD